jgi:hypothetical protein
MQGDRSHSHLTAGVAGLDMPLATELEECVILLGKTYNDHTSFHSQTRHLPVETRDLKMNFNHV